MKNPNASLIADCQALRDRIAGDGKNLTPHRDVAIAGINTAIDNLKWEFPEEKPHTTDTEAETTTDHGQRTIGDGPRTTDN
jgi:hypothetical protein